MKICLLIAVPDPETLDLIQSLLDEALSLVPLDIEASQINSQEELISRAQQDLDDIVFLDWLLAGADTPDLVRKILDLNPRLRVVVLLPLQLQQYRQCIWRAGACNSIPKEYMDQEWLSSILCLMHRAMEREAHLAKARS